MFLLRSLRYQETKELLEDFRLELERLCLFPVTPEQVYRRIYFEALDLIVSSIEERFDQPSFKAYSDMESLQRRFELARRILTNGLHERKLC